MPLISLQTVLRAVAEDQPWHALIDLNYLLARMPVVHSDLFRIRSQLLARLDHHAASLADCERAELTRGTLPEAVPAHAEPPGRYQARLPPAQLTVVVPVRNGGSIVRHCLESVGRNLTAGMQVLVVDDGTDDVLTLEALARFEAESGFHVRRHQGPAGFVAAVNAGLRQVPPGHVLLLNSDTYVPQGTLEALLTHLGRHLDLGTITPFSNNGGTFSMPLPRHRYAMPPPEQCEAIAQAALSLHQGVLSDVLTGNGFAMVIAADCRKALPELSTAFGSGYYEEVDYCLRARGLGFRNVCATDCFVGHIGSVSFGQSKRRLANDNLVLLEALHPGYGAEFNRFATFDPLRRFRQAIVEKVDWEATEIGADDLPSMHTVELPAILSWQGEPRFMVPTTGPLDSSRLDAATRSIRWLSADHLYAHGLQLVPPHHLRSAFVVHGQKAKLALIEGDELVSSIAVPITGPDRHDLEMLRLETAALHRLEAMHGTV